jgi:hypothetical protein
LATEHPKVTAYIPQEILTALDDWKQAHDIDSRSAAIVSILADYLGVRYPAPLQDTTPSSTVLSTVLTELGQLKERVAALEQYISTVPQAAPSTVAEPDEPSRSDVLQEVPSTALKESLTAVPVDDTKPGGEAPNTAPITAPLAPLTQSALAKRLGCSDKAIEKHRKGGSKEQFATWSGDRDPDGIAWTWQGRGGRGQPLQFMPDAKAE